MEEEILIEKIKNLFEELKEIRKGKLLPNKVDRLPLDGESFYRTAKSLVDKVDELSSINETYSAAQLYDVLGDEVEAVKNYTYDDQHKIKQSSSNKMDSLMKNALVHIRLECYDILGESKID
ncbi:MAG: hypothetical protein KBT33_05815 [Prevotellaceae bacterium]|nr:hypothetical protein [Candidatus Minthosoma equi]